ncbi:hypothetical protein GMORB2_6876 [Geosmithia morbida]|uniref:Uncharacterized protein n=1 Tax=Geosmithia morbida TaxID=1094350 RepID=A0A9P5D493_9HYPO|nr:uncharacterized protein GMORB2_6876 [Geosmithia morbida]KAF4122570.1 hypothetical protein GMORB2_6876 [Geosmithia morbida]
MVAAVITAVITATNLPTNRLPISRHGPSKMKRDLHHGWEPTCVAMAKCDMCSRAGRGVIYKCAQCKLSTCRECCETGQLDGDSRHVLDADSVSWDPPPRTSKRTGLASIPPSPSKVTRRGARKVTTRASRGQQASAAAVAAAASTSAPASTSTSTAQHLSTPPEATDDDDDDDGRDRDGTWEPPPSSNPPRLRIRSGGAAAVHAVVGGGQTPDRNDDTLARRPSHDVSVPPPNRTQISDTGPDHGTRNTFLPGPYPYSLDRRHRYPPGRFSPYTRPPTFRKTLHDSNNHDSDDDQTTRPVIRLPSIRSLFSQPFYDRPHQPSPRHVLASHLASSTYTSYMDSPARSVDMCLRHELLALWARHLVAVSGPAAADEALSLFSEATTEAALRLGLDPLRNGARDWLVEMDALVSQVAKARGTGI